MKVAIQKITIGYTRDQGYLLFDTDTHEFLEYSNGEVTRMLKSSDTTVCGLKLKNGKIELDLEGFNQENMMVKSSMSMGKFRLMKPNSLIKDSRLYSVVKAVDTGEELVYEIISNTCVRTFIHEEGVRQLYKDGVLSGVWVDSKTGQITLADAIQIEDANTSENGGEQHTKEDEAYGQNIDTGISADSLSAAGDNSASGNHGDGEDIHNEPSVKMGTSEQVEDSESLSTDETCDDEADPFSVFDEATPTSGVAFDSIEDILKDGEASDEEVDGLVDQEEDAYKTNDDMSQIGKKAYTTPKKRSSTARKTSKSGSKKGTSASKKTTKTDKVKGEADEK